MSLADLSRPGVRLLPSPWDSARFGLRFARLMVGEDTSGDELAATLPGLARDDDADLVIARWPAGLVGCGALLTVPQRVLLPADTLVYWAADLDTLRVPAHAPNEPVRPADAGSDPSALERVVTEVFAEYGHHYAANPLLDPALAVAGYAQWAARTVADPSSVSAVIQDRQGAGSLAGLATATVDGPVVEVELAGVTAALAGSGAYAALLAAVAGQARARGADRLVISTQAGNIRVQRRWVALGLRPVSAFTTVHSIRRLLWEQRADAPQGDPA